MKIEPYITTKKAAETLSVTTKTIRNWIRAGKLGPVLLISPTDARIPVSVLEKFIADHTVKSR